MRPPSGSPISEEPLEGDDPTDEELFSVMAGQWVEVECLLRVELRSSEALEAARERVSESLTFDRRLGKAAADSGQLKGTIFQALLAKADGSSGHASASSCSVEMSDGAGTR